MHLSFEVIFDHLKVNHMVSIVFQLVIIMWKKYLVVTTAKSTIVKWKNWPRNGANKFCLVTKRTVSSSQLDPCRQIMMAMKLKVQQHIWESWTSSFDHYAWFDRFDHPWPDKRRFLNRKWPKIDYGFLKWLRIVL